MADWLDKMGIRSNVRGNMPLKVNDQGKTIINKSLGEMEATLNLEETQTTAEKELDTIYKTVLMKSKHPYEINIIITRENKLNKDTFFFAPSDMMKK